MTETENVNFRLKLAVFLDNFRKLLEYKNQKYGDSALTPIKVFSKLESVNSIENRIDDKLSRIKNSNEPNKNDVIDLIGYLTLYSLNQGWVTFDEFQD